MTETHPTDQPPTAPRDAPVVGGSATDRTADELEPGSRHPLTADEGEPDVEPFAGDDDILSGHLDTDR